MSYASEADNADWFIQTFNGIGLTFDIRLDGDDAWSHSTRIRALNLRVLEAYESLTDEARLAAAYSAAGSFLSLIQGLEHIERLPRIKQLSERMLVAFQNIGWGYQDKGLVMLDPQIREMFYPKGSQWDAFMAIRKEVDNAQNELLLVDPYCDRGFFEILGSSTARPKLVRLLCRKNSTALKHEATIFHAQNAQVSFELRTSKDFHDRFLIVDGATCVHIGASIEHAGSRAFMISKVEDSSNRDALIKAVNEAWDKGVKI